MAKRRKGKSKRKGNDRKRSKKQRKKLLARVTRDNKVTKKERRKLQKAGISSNKARNYQINKSRPKNNSRSDRGSTQKAYTPLKIKGSGSWGSKSSSSSRSRSSSSSSNNNANRSSGKFIDIRSSLREDSSSGQDAAASLQNQSVSQANNYQSIIDDLRAQQAAAEAANQQALQQQAEASANSLANLNDLFVGQMDDVSYRMAEQQEAFNTAQAFTNEQLNAANNAFLAEQKRSANMANAYVPQANPTASSIGYGDGRRITRRKRQDNQLSDLTLLSGLGSQANPLAGLQLA